MPGMTSSKPSSNLLAGPQSYLKHVVIILILSATSWYFFSDKVRPSPEIDDIVDPVPLHLQSSFDFSKQTDGSTCYQPSPLVPAGAKYPLFDTFEFRNSSLAKLQAAVRVPTETFDDLGAVGQDPRWEVFFKYEQVLKDAFPLLHKHLTLDHVNTHGLMYTWKGSDSSLKPTMFMAHQDVVPVLPASHALWSKDPYSAEFDGEKIWGRGTSDMKGTMIAVMSAIELLLERHSEGKLYKPRRTIILAFGFDEEISGNHGAARMGQYLLKKYGENGINSIVDEGGMGVLKYKDVLLALPGVAEKGMYDSQITVYTPGGHSSIPPDHTGIGIAGALISKMEKTPFEPTLSTRNPVYGFLQCLAAYSHMLPAPYREAILASGKSRKANAAVRATLGARKATRYMITTSQALDVVEGGMKVNALPERVSITANFRIAMEETINSTRAKVISNAEEIAREFGVGLLVNRTKVVRDEFGSLKLKAIDVDETGRITNELIAPTKNGYIVVSDFGTHVDPAPVTPTSGEAWEVFAGTVRHVFEEHAGPIVNPASKNETSGLTNKPVVVVPSLMLANTDTKHYWKLTKNIYRFSAARLTDMKLNNIHTVDEYVPLELQIESTKFYYTYILNL